MKPSFAETMQGMLIDSAGGGHDVRFEIEARGEGGGYFGVTGRVNALPWADQAPATGTLVISPTLRFIRYRVRFAVGEAEWELRGEKTPSLLAPLKSLTTLPMELVDSAGTRRATGELSFSLRDLPGFAASWLTLSSWSRR